MKITCDSCGSKYTIADAKVQGRKVKVRCKSCKGMILVDGTQEADEGGAPASDAGDDDASGEASAAASAAAVADVGGADEAKKDLWSVNLTDDDSRDMSTAELVAGWKSGLVTTDAYVWKDGMDDWTPVLEVPELKQKLLAAKPLKTDGVVSSAKPAAAAGAAAAASNADDLFGGVDLAGGEDDPGQDIPVPTGGEDDEKPTGARNESSVLFSLDALGAAPQSADKTEASAVFGNIGGGGGGGLGANTDLLTAPAADPPPAPAGARSAAAPAAPAKSKMGVLIAAILGGAAIIGVALFMVMGGDGGDSEAAEKAAKEAEELRAELARKEKERAEEMKQFQDKMMAELKAAREDAANRGEDPEAAAAKKKAELEEAKKKEEEAKKADEAKPSGSSASKPSGSSASKPSGSSASKPSSSSSSSSGAPFDVGAAKAALAAAAANAASCKKPGGPTGSGRVQITFAPSGRVTSANVVSGPFGGTPTGGCVASTFRRARVPKFSGSPKTVAKSFRIN